MPWRGPSYEGEFPSLGWLFADWVEDTLKVPAGPHYGKPLRLTDEQLQFWVRFYALRPDGSRVYRRGSRRGAKGKGKSPEAAAWMLAEFAGPVVFDGWDADGEPVGMPQPNPLCQVAAVAEDQTQNVYRTLREMAADVVDDLGIDLGKTRVEFRDGRPGEIRAVTSSSATLEGAPATAMAMDEALAVTTPIPTPTGWTKMGTLAVGDQVLGRDGNPVSVVKVTDVAEDRRCFDVRFDDGTSMVASEGHLWFARGRHHRFGRVVDTRTMFEIGGRWRIPVAEPVELPHRDLPVQPWCLGMWLGDGSTGQGCVSSSAGDAEWTASEFRRAGYHVNVKHHQDGRASRLDVRRDPATCPFGHDDFYELTKRDGGIHRHCRECRRIRRRGGEPTGKTLSFRERLKQAGVLHQKHIPTEYLRASVEQRLALLQGLMDSDGHIGPDSYATFVTAEPKMVHDVAELVRSLGETPRIAIRIDSRKSSYGPNCKVYWRASSDRPPVRMPRKAANLKPRQKRQRWVTISEVVEVPPEPVRCIAVDNDDHLFLAGDGWKTTHNTHLWLPTRGGTRFAAGARRNAAKTAGGVGVTCEFTNAPALGEGTVAEDTLEQANKGAEGLLYDSTEAPWVEDPKDPDAREEVMAALEVAYGEAAMSAGGWVYLDRIYDEILDPATTVSDVRRFYFNQAVKDESRAVDPNHWKAAADSTVVVPDGAEVVLFFDGARTRDSAALVGWTLDESPHLFEVETWVRPDNADDGYEHPRGGFRRAVSDAMDRYNAVLAYDESFHELSSLYDEWHEQFDPHDDGRVIGFPTHSGKRMEQAITRFLADLSEGLFTHDGSTVTSEHIRNAVLGRNRGGWLALSKPSDSLKIDAAVSAVAGYELVGTARELLAKLGDGPAVFVKVIGG